MRKYDLLHPDTHTDDPWPMYTYLREEEPLYWDEKNELWAVSRWEDIVTVAGDETVFCSTEGNLPNMPPDPSMINQDGDQHTLQRKLVSHGFTPSRMRALEGVVRSTVVELIEAVQEAGRCDAVDDLARPLPLRLIGDMLGHPREDHAMLGELTDIMVLGGCGPDYVGDEVNEAFERFLDYHTAAVAARQEAPKDDILTIWMNAEINGQKLEEDQLLFEHVLVNVGGSETTRNVLSCGIEMLIRHPDQRQYLIEHLDDEDAVHRAVEEMIRWSTPFTRMVRTAVNDVEMHGKTIRAGQQVMMMYPAATRDPRVFENPDVFDIRRPAAKHNIAFGHGRHLCLGMNLARLEIRTFFEELLRRIPDMQFAPGTEPVKRRSSFLRGLISLPVVFTPVPIRR